MSAAEAKGGAQAAALEEAERGLALALAAVEGAFDAVSVALEAVLAAKRAPGSCGDHRHGCGAGAGELAETTEGGIYGG